MSREPDDDDRLVLPAGDRTREWRKEEEKGVYLLLPLLSSLPPARGPGPIITGLSRGEEGGGENGIYCRRGGPWSERGSSDVPWGE